MMNAAPFQNAFKKDRPKIIESLKSFKLNWTEHLARIREDHTAFKVEMSRPGGKEAKA